jgi:hypothetical protein
MSEKEYLEHEFGEGGKAKIRKKYGPDARLDGKVVKNVHPKPGMKLTGGGVVKDVYSKKIVTGASKKFAEVHYDDGKVMHHRVDQTTFHAIHEEVIEESPSGIRPEGEKAFAARHKIEIVNHGISNEVQHTAHDIPKDKTKKASYEDGQDDEAYHGHTTPINPSNLGIKGKLKEAADDSKYHADAAERHQKAAEAARADGKKMLAAQHEKKAAKHREIYKQHKTLEESFAAGSPYHKAFNDAKKHIHAKYHPVLKHAMHKMEGGGSEHEEFSKIHLGSGHERVRETLKKHNILEDVQQIDEISKGTAERYVDANRKEGEKTIDKYASAKGDEKKALSKKIDKRRAGLNRAMKKLQEDGNTFADFITEISSKTLGSYIKKASDSATLHAHSAGGSAARGGEFHGHDFKKAIKRVIGIKTAASKLEKKAAE